MNNDREQIILTMSDQGWACRRIAHALGFAKSTVFEVIQRRDRQRSESNSQPASRDPVRRMRTVSLSAISGLY